MRLNTPALLLLISLPTGALLAEQPLATSLPLGDGKVSTIPKVGYVMACNQNFRGGGARHAGEWIQGDTWFPQQKPAVKGRVTWPEATFVTRSTASTLQLTMNNLPVGAPTGSFPIARNDPAYAYDTNPNAIAAMPMAFDIPLVPQKAATPGCLSMGMIGFTVSGVALYNALDDAGHDAAAHEVQDLCDGHPQGKGQYHYHSGSACQPEVQSNNLVGYALDGYPILGMRDASGALLSNADLDACHGRTEAVQVDGRSYDYAYRLTQAYPYTLGCFTGEVSPATTAALHQAMGPPRARGQAPGGQALGARAPRRVQP